MLKKITLAKIFLFSAICPMHEKQNQQLAEKQTEIDVRLHKFDKELIVEILEVDHIIHANISQKKNKSCSHKKCLSICCGTASYCCSTMCIPIIFLCNICSKS